MTITADASYLSADTTCITADGFSGCVGAPSGNNDGQMGPGFFIFFKALGFGGGGSTGRPTFPSIALEWRAASKLRRKLAYYRKEEVDELITARVAARVADSMVKDWDQRPAIKAYDIDSAEAERRLREFIEQYIRRIEEDEIALLLIFANV